jgi:hypothetical protein
VTMPSLTSLGNFSRRSRRTSAGGCFRLFFQGNR